MKSKWQARFKNLIWPKWSFSSEDGKIFKKNMNFLSLSQLLTPELFLRSMPNTWWMDKIKNLSLMSPFKPKATQALVNQPQIWPSDHLRIIGEIPGRRKNKKFDPLWCLPNQRRGQKTGRKRHIIEKNMRMVERIEIKIEMKTKDNQVEVNIESNQSTNNEMSQGTIILSPKSTCL